MLKEILSNRVYTIGRHIYLTLLAQKTNQLYFNYLNHLHWYLNTIFHLIFNIRKTLIYYVY